MNFENTFPLSTDFVTTIEICNKKLFRQIFCSLTDRNCLNDEFEPFVLIDETCNTEISADSIVIITDVRNFEMDNKYVLAAVNDRIKKYVNTDEDILHKFQKISNDIFSLLLDFSDEFECDFIVSEKAPDVSKLLKLYQFTVENTESQWFDKLLNIITLYADLFFQKVLCFFNVKEWLTPEEADTLINHIVCQKIRVLFIESVETPKHYDKEYKVIIDDDFDETVLKNCFN